MIDVLTHVGLLEKFAGDAGINNVAGYSMTAGVITVPNTAGAPRWAAPGYYCAWNGAQTNEGGFQILDVTQDATNTYVTTSLSNTGWPTVPLTSGKLFVQVHPCPKMTFTNCTGCPEAVTFSNAPAGLPLGSYYNFTFNPTNVLVASDAPVWGSPTSVTLNVTSAYSGASNPLTLEAVLPLVTPGSASISFYDAFINLRTAGSRVSTPSGGSSGGQAGDSGLTGLPAVSWCSGDFAYAFAPDVSGSSPTIPVVTVTIVTDQGITWP